jgi:hypothetical protein
MVRKSAVTVTSLGGRAEIASHPRLPLSIAGGPRRARLRARPAGVRAGLRQLR